MSFDLKKFLAESKIPLNEESEASKEAKKRGLTHVSYGNYADSSGNIVAKSVDGKLVKVSDGGKEKPKPVYGKDRQGKVDYGNKPAPSKPKFYGYGSGRYDFGGGPNDPLSKVRLGTSDKMGQGKANPNIMNALKKMGFDSEFKGTELGGEMEVYQIGKGAHLSWNNKTNRWFIDGGEYDGEIGEGPGELASALEAGKEKSKGTPRPKVPGARDPYGKPGSKDGPTTRPMPRLVDPDSDDDYDDSGDWGRFEDEDERGEPWDDELEADHWDDAWDSDQNWDNTVDQERELDDKGAHIGDLAGSISGGRSGRKLRKSIASGEYDRDIEAAMRSQPNDVMKLIKALTKG